MGLLTKAIGLACAAYSTYILFIFFAFTIDLKRDFGIVDRFPSINDRYNKPFNIMGFAHMLFWIISWGIHHSLFARGWMAKIVANVVTPQLERSIYVFGSAILLDWMMFDPEIQFGGGILWNIKPWNQSNFFVRNSIAIIGSSYFDASLCS